MSSKITVSVFIPHLFDSLQTWHTNFFFVPETDLLVPLLNQFSVKQVAPEDFISSLYTSVGFNNQNSFPPHAITCYHYDFGKMPTEAVLLATPIHLQTGMTDVTVDGSVVNDISSAEAEALQKIINQHFQQDNMRLERSASGRWYVLLPFSLMPEKTYSVNDVLGNSLFPFLHHTKQLEWNRLLNELQMLLYTATVNQQRENKGLRRVSSFWLWGNAHCHSDVEKVLNPAQASLLSVNHVIAGGFNGKAFSHALKAQWHPRLPSKIDDNMVVIIDDLLRPSLCNDIDQWQAALTRIEANYIKPLTQYGLAHSSNVELILNSCDGRQWRKRSWYQNLLLRKKKALVDYAI